MTAIEASELAKTFVVRHRRQDAGLLGRLRRERKDVRAVDGVTFEIARGEMVGYIGPNGAGKSTTIKMLTGILVPSTGIARVAGMVPWRERVSLARKIGVVFGQRTQLWWDLPLRDSFELLQHIYRIPDGRFRENLDDLIELLEMGDFLQTPVRQLSLGQRMRGDLAASVLHEPDLLFLDEPTIGLDIVAKARVHGFLETVNRERGLTIMMTTHDLSDIERLCKRMLIIDRGRVIFDGPVAEIADRFGGERTLVVDLAEPLEPIRINGARTIRVDGPRQWLRFRRTDTSAAFLIAEVARRVPIVDLAVEEPNIEHIVRDIYIRGPEPREPETP